MTSSFSNLVGTERDAPLDISKYNYEATAPDLAKSVNENIDENRKAMADYFNHVIELSNNRHKQKSKIPGNLLKLTQSGIRLGNEIRKINQAKTLLAEFYNTKDSNQVQSYLAEDAKTEQLLQQSEAQKAENYTVAGELERQGDANSEIVNILKSGTHNTTNKRIELDQMNKNWPIFKATAEDKYVHKLENGNLIRLSQAGTLEEYRQAYRGLVELYLSQYVEDFSPRMLRRQVIAPLYKTYEADSKKWLEAVTAAQVTEHTTKRKQELILGISEEGNGGTALVNYINTYYGYHDRSWANARKEAFGFIEDGIKSQEIDAAKLEEILNHQFLAHDNTVKKVRDLWKAESSSLEKLVRTTQTEEMNERVREDRALKIKFNLDSKAEWLELPANKRNESWIKEKQKEHIAKFGTKSDFLNELESVQDILDDTIVEQLKERSNRGEKLTTDDLIGITDYDTLQHWTKKVEQPGLSQQDIKDRDSFIKGQASRYTLEEDADKAKTPKYIAVEQQAREVFNDAYKSIISLPGKTQEDAIRFAREETIKAIDSGQLDSFPSYNPDAQATQDILNVKKSIQSNPYHLYSEQPWVGEDPHLLAALRYLSTGQGSIPDYYRNFSRLGTTKIAPYELMMLRLQQTGNLKGTKPKPIPERELEPVNQDKLLYKPSAARTLSVLGDPNVDNNTLVEASGYEDEESLVSDLRLNAERNNAFNGLDIAQVNIEPSLIEEYTQVVGEQPWANQLNNLHPGVAKALIEDTFNV